MYILSLSNNKQVDATMRILAQLSQKWEVIKF